MALAQDPAAANSQAAQSSKPTWGGKVLASGNRLSDATVTVRRAATGGTDAAVLGTGTTDQLGQFSIPSTMKVTDCDVISFATSGGRTSAGVVPAAYTLAVEFIGNGKQFE